MKCVECIQQVSTEPLKGYPDRLRAQCKWYEDCFELVKKEHKPFKGSTLF